MEPRHDKLAHARSFGGIADAYEAARPGYPPVAVSWLVHPDEVRVVDVGAGTGKLSRALLATGHEVVAVDPSAEMLTVLRTQTPDIGTLVGTGEQLPIPDGSVDAVSYAQAWHWVDPPAASAEAARVLRPGGTLALVWNFRDERVEWVRELGVAMRAETSQYTPGADEFPHVGEPFGAPERAQFEWRQTVARDDILRLAASRSYVAVMDADGRDQALAAVRELLDTHPQTAGEETLSLPYVTVAFRYTKP